MHITLSVSLGLSSALFGHNEWEPDAQLGTIVHIWLAYAFTDSWSAVWAVCCTVNSTWNLLTLVYSGFSCIPELGFTESATFSVVWARCHISYLSLDGIQKLRSRHRVATVNSGSPCCRNNSYNMTGNVVPLASTYCIASQLHTKGCGSTHRVQYFTVGTRCCQS